MFLWLEWSGQATLDPEAQSSRDGEEALGTQDALLRCLSRGPLGLPFTLRPERRLALPTVTAGTARSGPGMLVWRFDLRS